MHYVVTWSGPTAADVLVAGSGTMTGMGYDTLHLGWYHPQFTLWAGQGRDLVPGDRVELRDNSGLLDYDVDVQVTRVHVRAGVLCAAELPAASVCLTGWGEPADTAQSAPNLLSQHEAEVASVELLFTALGLSDDARAASVLADESVSPQNCPVCARVRGEHSGPGR